MPGRVIEDNGGVTTTTPATREPQLVIFDLDGTLTDSAEGIVSSFRHALGQVGVPVPEGDLAGRIVGPPMHHTLSAMGLGEHTDAAIAAYRADYTTRGWAMNSLYDGIADLLAGCRDGGAAGLDFAIGGPDGLDGAVTAAATRTIRFGQCCFLSSERQNQESVSVR